MPFIDPTQNQNQNAFVDPMEQQGVQQQTKQNTFIDPMEQQGNQQQFYENMIPEGMGGSVWQGLKHGVMDVGRGLKQSFLRAEQMVSEITPEKEQELKRIGYSPKEINDMKTDVQKISPEDYFKQTQLRDAQDSAYQSALLNHPVMTSIGGISGNILGWLPAFLNPAVGVLGKGADTIPAVIENSARAFRMSQGVVKALTTTAKGATMLGKGAVGGGMVGGLSLAPDDAAHLNNMLIGSAIGGALSPLVPAARGIFKIGKNWLGHEPLIDNEAALAKAQEEVAKTLPAVQKEGLPSLTAGALTQDPGIQAQEQNILMKQGTQQQALLQQKMNQINEGFKDAFHKMKTLLQGGNIVKKDISDEGIQDLEFNMGGAIQNSLRSTDEESRKVISKLYDAAAEAPGNDIPVGNKLVLDTLDIIQRRFPKSISSDFSEDVDGFINRIRNGEQLTVKEMNEFARALNDNYKMTSKMDLTQRLAIGKVLYSVYNSLDAMAVDDKNPSKELFNLARSARSQLGGVFDIKTLAEDIRKEGGVDPEHVIQQLFGRKGNNITSLTEIENALKFKLDPETGTKVLNPEGEKNWDDMRQFIFSKLLNDSTDASGNLNAIKLSNNYLKFGTNFMTKIFGNEEAAQKFDNIMNILKTWQTKKPGVINFSNTSTVLINRFKDLLNKIPGIGWLNKMFETIHDNNWLQHNFEMGQKGIALKQPSINHFIPREILNASKIPVYTYFPPMIRQEFNPPTYNEESQ